MAKTSVTLQAPDTRMFRPQRGVEDKSTAAAISGLGNILATGVDIKQGMDKRQAEFDKQQAAAAASARELAFQKDITNFSDSVVAAATGEEISPAAQKSLDKFDRGINLLSNSDLKESNVKIRAESMLKHVSDAHPEQAAKFREIASGVLGFSVQGSQLAAVFDQQAANVNANAALKKQYLSIGGDINTWGTPAATQWFKAESALVQDQASQQRRLDFAKTTKQLNSLDAPMELQESSKSMQATTLAQASALVQGVFNKPLYQITDKDIAGMDAVELQQLTESIQQIKESNRQRQTNNFLAFENISNTDVNAGRVSTRTCPNYA